jgi:hypothetical protein
MNKSHELLATSINLKQLLATILVHPERWTTKATTTQAMNRPKTAIHKASKPCIANINNPIATIITKRYAVY